MTPEIKKALDLALEALEPFSTPNWAGTGVDKVNAAIAAIRQVRSAPVQEMTVVDPADWVPCTPEWINQVGDCAKSPRVWSAKECNHYHPASPTAAQPAQPAPANLWLYWKVDNKSVITGPFKTPSKDEAYGLDCIDQTQLTVPAAQRTWVGLTDEEYSDLYFSVGYAENVALWKAIEAKLKEKNNGGSKPRESP